METETVLGIPFNKVKSSEIPHVIDRFIHNGRHNIIVTPNPEMVLESLKNKQLREVLQQSSLSIPDGIGILWASKFLSLPSRPKWRILFQWIGTLLSLLFYPKYCKTVLPERVTGVDSMKQICRHSEQMFYSVFLLGGRDNVAELTKMILEKDYQKIKIVGTHAGIPFSKDDTSIIARINVSKPDILFVAFGSPKQELWIHEHLKELPTVRIAMGIGGAFDFISGAMKRAPQWMRKIGLEWLFRLFQEPKKRTPRIWNAVVVFPFKVLLYKLSH